MGCPDSVHGVSDPVLQLIPLGPPPWPTIDPFLFCVHHVDAYPAGNELLGPMASLAGRDIGQDFSGRDGWSMYHGRSVPGFPRHPHRGFETVTFVRRGLIDHSDSLGASARYGEGDVQWMTAGRGIVHAEMFPLLHADEPNPAELFQIWVNLPRTDKLVDPHFSMFWDEGIPRHLAIDDEGRSTEVTVVAGVLGEARPASPPPHSWATRPDAYVAIWHLRLDPHARWILPPADGPDTGRMLYVFEGDGVSVASHAVGPLTAAVLQGDVPVTLTAGPTGAECLLLQGRPIGEPVAQYGPFVMNDRAGIEKAFADYQATGFGGWTWPVNDPVHGREGRFARHADGRLDAPTSG